MDYSTQAYSLYQSVTRAGTFNQVCTSSTSDAISWRFCQAFGDDNSSDDDFITSVEFDPTGNYVTVGDKAGRLCLFEASSGGSTYRSCINDLFDEYSAKVSYPYPRRQKVPNTLEDSALSEKYQKWLNSEQLDDFEIPDFDVGQFDPMTSPYSKYIMQRCKNGLMTKTIGQAAPTEPNSDDAPQSTLPKHLEYKFYTEFQSHDVEFDCLKSSDIPSTINAIKWVESTPTSQSILAANDKTIKLWSLRDKVVTTEIPNTSLKGPGSYIIPQRVPFQTVTLALRKAIYQNAHTYHINSLSPSTNGQNFLSSDDVRILLWDYEYPMQPFNIVDIRPPQLEEITEVITSASMHPSTSDLLLYSTSRGCLKLCDLRMNALCDQNVHTRSFDREEDPVSKSFFSEIVSCISDAKFTRSGQYIVSRDFLHVYIWDSRNESRPVAIFNVHDHLRNNLSDLYEFDSLFDSFRLDSSPDGLQVITGSYHNNFSVHNWLTGSTLNFEAGQRIPRKRTKLTRRKQQPGAQISSPLQLKDGDVTQANTQSDDNDQAHTSAPVDSNKIENTPTNGTIPSPSQSSKNDRVDPVNISLINFNRKALHVAWHPSLDCIAVAGVNKLYIYQGFPQQDDEVL